MIDNDVELIVASRTQTPEALTKLMQDDGFDVETTVLSDQPAESAPVTEQTPPATTDSSVPPPAAGSEAAGPVEGETRTDSETVQTQEQHEPKKSGSGRLKRKLQERDATIGELQGNLKSREDEIAELRRKLADPPAAPAPKTETPAPAEAKPAVEPKPKPKLDDFADEDDPYLALSEALVDWKLEQRDQAAPAKAAAAAQPAIDPEALKARQTAWQAEISDAKGAYADFDQAIQKDHGKPVCNPIMTDAVQQLKGGGKLVYWLATHPDEANRIHEMTAPAESDTPYARQQKFATAIAEIARINLGTPAAQQPPVQQPATQQPPASAPAVPKAKPTPPSTVGSRGNPGYRTLQELSEKEIRDMDMLEFERRRKAGELS